MFKKKHLARILFFALLLGGAVTVSAQETFGAAITRYLKLGSVGEDVKTLQGTLANLQNIYPEGLITGYYGKLTAKAVSAFQTQNNLAAVGIVGPQTLVEVNKLLNTPSVSQGQGEQSAEALTLKLLSLKRAYAQTLSDPAKANLINQMRTLIAQRKQTILALLSGNTANALTVAFSPETVNTFPQEIQALLEQNTILEGTATILHVDYEDESLSRYEYTLTTKEGKTITLHFAKNPPHSFVTGATIRAKGVKVEDNLAVNDGEEVTLLAAPGGGGGGSGGGTTEPPLVQIPTFGAQKTLVIAVNFQDAPTNQPWTKEQIQNVIFSTTSSFYLESSYNQTYLSGDVYGWFTIALNNDGICNDGQIASLAQQAAVNAGANLSAYTHYVYVFPSKAGCTWAGLSTVGGNPSKAWINSLKAHTVAHELGHGMGLWHSRSLNCGTVTLSTNCTTVEYGDVIDTMGGPIGFLPTAHFNAFQKWRLGWLGYNVSPPITTVTSNGAYTIAPYETSGLEPKVLKILKSTDPTTGAKTWYYLEYREPIGTDVFLTSVGSNVPNGTLFHLGTESIGNSSNMLNMHPETSDWWDVALEVGRTFTDPDAGITFTTIATSTTAATVQVTFGTPVCTHNNPTITLSPSSQTGTPGANLSYTVTVKNNDNSICSSSVFSVTPTLPPDFTQTPTPLSLTLAPGATGSGTVTVNSPVTAAGGFYTITETAVNTSATSYSGTASATYVVDATAVDTTAPVTSITYPTNGGTIPKGQSISITASATDNYSVMRTEFFVNGSLKCTATASPYSCRWSVPKGKTTTHQFYTKAYDMAGNVGTSATVSATAQ